MSQPNPDKPVRLSRVYLDKSVHIQGPTGGTTSEMSLDDSHKGYRLELLWRQRIVRAWHSKLATARVTTIPLENVTSFEVAGEVETLEAATGAAPSVA